jgi:hypothetical protein
MNADQRVRRMHGAPLALLGLLLVALAGPSVAQAVESPVKLALLPVAQPGAYFDLTLRPGDTRSLQVDIANLGDAEIAARSYATDVYTIINGGFGGRLRDTPQTGVTTWLDYPTDVIALSAGTTIRRAFAVTVPKDAAPGEYITALVLENDRPIANNGPVALDQVMRQAIAVVVTVPGPRTPSLSIGAATHEVVAGKSVVSVAVQNTGNVRLKPLVTLALFDGASAQVSTASLQMDTFYAYTNTTVEIAQATLLPPGDYTVTLTLVDAASGARAEKSGIALVVDLPAVVTPGAGSMTSPGPASVDSGKERSQLPTVGVALALGLLLGGLLVGLLWLALERRRRAMTPRT